MRKIITTALGLSSMIALAQGNPNDYYGRMGVNTTTPKATLHIVKSPKETDPQRPQGVLFPDFTSAERLKFKNVQEGTMIYNKDKKCLEMYMGLVSGNPHWSCLPDANSPQAQRISIEPLNLTGTYISGVALNNGNKVSFRLKNNGLTAISNVNFADAVTVTNGTANITVNGSANNNVTLQAGGTKDLVYTLSGTPTTGQLTARFDKFGMTAERSTTVGLGTATIGNKEQYVVSLVYNGTTVQGKINNTTDKLTIKIPYTNGQGSYNAVNITKTSAPGQGNDTNNLTLNIPAGTFSTAGELTATITVDGDQEYLVKQLAPGQKQDIATYDINMNGVTYQVKLVAIGGIPDKRFGQQTFGQYEHQFIYVPIQGPDGRTWLNNNLGAEYARVGSPYFNPTRQAGALDYTNLTTSAAELSNPTADQIKKDWRAYGYLYEWARDSDGHELWKWSSSTSGTYRGSGYTTSGNGAASYQRINDPCPTGFRTPTNQEFLALLNTITGLNTQIDDWVDSTAIWAEKDLKLTTNGYGIMGYTSHLVEPDRFEAFYWSSTQHPRPDEAYGFSLNDSGGGVGYATRIGYSAVRCIAD